MPRPEGWAGSDLRARAEVAQWLHDHGDEVHDPTGLIVGRIRTELNKGRAISQLIADMDRDGMIEREVNGRRTLMIKLVDDWGLLSDLRQGKVGPAYREPSRTVKDGDGVDLSEVDLTKLAETLLATVIKRATLPASQGAETERLREKCVKLEAQLRETRDALILAREAENESRRNADKMRDSLVKLQSQMDRKPKGGGTPLVERLKPAERRMLENLMKEVPSSR